MSSTAAVASSVTYHLPNQDFSHRDSSKSTSSAHIHSSEDINYNACTSHVQLSSNQIDKAVRLNDSAKLVSSNIDSALRSSLKPWMSSSKVSNMTLQTTNAPEIIQRSLNFHESSAPPLDSVIRQRIESHPKSLILCESSSSISSSIKRSLCTDAELASWCRSGTEQVPSQSLGLGNSGNTCYLNSVLQCLLATGPLLAYINAKHCNASNCFVATGQMGPNKSRFCALCGVLRLVREHNQRSEQAGARTPSFGFGQILPSYFLANVRAVCPGFRPYQQEDAHEFLLGLLSRMEDSSTAGLGKLPRSVSETNPIRRIFGGVVRSEVTCHTCHNVSARDEICFNLSVDITCGRSLQQCLFNYIHSEELCGQNAYKCEKCRQYRSATRRSTIFQGGPILIIQFNRFSRSQKLDTRVEFPSSFNLRPFMTDNKGPPVLYRLYATVNHEGYSCRSGHYVAFTRRHGTWLSHNDSFVNSTNVDHVLRQAPYLLFYEATNPVFANPTSTPNSTPVSPTTQQLRTSVADSPVKLTKPVTSLVPNPVPLAARPVVTTSHAAPISVPLVSSTLPPQTQQPPPPITVPRIVFNPNVKQKISPTTTALNSSAPSASAAETRLSLTSPTKTTEHTTSDTVTSNSSALVTPLLRPGEILSTKQPLAPTLKSTTVHQLLYGDTSTPGLWSERSTPPINSDSRSRSHSSTKSTKEHARITDEHTSSPSAEKRSSASFTPNSLKTSSSSKSSEPSTSHERNCEQHTPYTHNNSSQNSENRRRRRRSSESSSDSSIVWVPNSKSSRTDWSSEASHASDPLQTHSDRKYHHHHHDVYRHRDKKPKEHRPYRDPNRRHRSDQRHGSRRHHQTDRKHRVDRRERSPYHHRHHHRGHRRTHDSHKRHNGIKHNNVFHRSPEFHHTA